MNERESAQVYGCCTKLLFYRMLLHPDVTEEHLGKFMKPIIELANDLPQAELVVFFDEVNTSSCIGFFKEMFMDRSIQVHQLPQSLEHLKCCYGTLPNIQLEDYIKRKISMFEIYLNNKSMPLETYAQETLCHCIIRAQEFCTKHLSENAVSQREIQRCFQLIDFFWNLKYDNEIYEPNPHLCIALSIALVYYFRLLTNADREERNDKVSPTREQLSDIMSRTFLSNFNEMIQNELEKFVLKWKKKHRTWSKIEKVHVFHKFINFWWTT
ncbi:unnamed protein product [Didymodactylos carnosus]|uniref:Uncharacterized protein n=1 Tax=Didymodactylos carnosus TaxID=1234261 RepID=A0A815TI05_9BILA|nr:unnamed protein product [Didymodactylos carnosus]CAF1508818.1 unnamed protein product [Didymodactylos carnosus]CAF4228033.1 unnamed protein product [Didymodactylos carnosus]CAF4369844.1 unnamed protein product [Didymodactylos carnosus]